MAGPAVVRDSFAIFVMVVLTAYAVSLLLNVSLGLAEVSRRGWDLVLAGILLAVVTGLGFLLRRIVEFEAES